MDQGVCLSEEHGSDVSNGDRGVSQIVYRDYQASDCEGFAHLLAEYWLKVCGEELEDPLGKMADLSLRRIVFRVALISGEIVGFLLYHRVYQAILIIDGLYVQERSEAHGIGKGLIQSQGGEIKKVIFQTHRTNNPPERLYSILKHAEKIHEYGDFSVWEMPWL